VKVYIHSSTYKTMGYEILFIQGAGNLTTTQEQVIVDALRANLGDECMIVFPSIPNADEPTYRAWDDVLTTHVYNLSGKAILIGHSLGASVILKHFSMAPVPDKIAGIILLGTPYWKDQDWDVSEYVIGDDFVANLRQLKHIFFYYSLDDEVIPYKQQEAYQQLLPQANWRIIAGVDHSYHGAIDDIIKDIRELVSLS
jgi:uncharacterized protein